MTHLGTFTGTNYAAQINRRSDDGYMHPIKAACAILAGCSFGFAVMLLAMGVG